jgi:hypothetical protein
MERSGRKTDLVVLLAVLVMQASRDFFKVEVTRSIRGMGSFDGA